MDKRIVISALLVIGIGIGGIAVTAFRPNEAGSVAQTTATPSLVASPTATPETESSSVELVAVGDIMLARYVEKAFVSRKDINFPFKKMSTVLQSADLAFGNLECPITSGPEVPAYVMRFNCNEGLEVALEDAGFDILSLANNHMGDFGAKGVSDTVATLAKTTIKGVGAGATNVEAEAPVVLEKNGMKIAFLAYNDPDVVPESYSATATKAGSNFLDVNEIANAVPAAQKLADIVIVSMHSGTEYTSHHSVRQETFAHAAIDAGATLVIGHHPHVAQDIEEYKGKYIIYSLGNFIFDQVDPETKQGLVAHITLNKKGVEKLRFSTVYIEHWGQPFLQTEEESQEIFTRIGWVQPPEI